MTTALTRLGPIERAPNMQTGRTEQWGAPSADGLWTFVRLDEPGTPWSVIHTPTGLDRPLFGSRDAARRWTADTKAAEQTLLIEQLSKLQTPEQRGNDELRRAGRAVRILTGRTLIKFAQLPAESICNCDGFLVSIDGDWKHLDACKWCVDEGVRCDRAADKHDAMCDYPHPATCDHRNCTRQNDLMAVGCVTGKDLCCGCCHGEC